MILHTLKVRYYASLKHLRAQRVTWQFEFNAGQTTMIMGPELSTKELQELIDTGSVMFKQGSQKQIALLLDHRIQ
jgi:predicted  nucleic acid-binding Zn ribbon protein